MYALYFLRLNNFKRKKWKILQYSSEDSFDIQSLSNALEARSIPITDLLREISSSFKHKAWYLLGSLNLEKILGSHGVIGWKGKWEAFVFSNGLLLCDTLGDKEIEERKKEITELGFQIERKPVPSGKVRKIRKALMKDDKTLFWRKLWVGNGIYNAGIQTVTIGGIREKNLNLAARHLASKADGFNPGFEQDGAEIGWKIEEDSLVLNRHAKDFKAEVQAEKMENLLQIIEQL